MGTPLADGLTAQSTHIDTTDNALIQAAKAGTLKRDTIIDSLIGIEGGYVNNKNDSGGETNYGITKAVALSFKDALVKLYKWDGTMRNLTPEMARYIYRVSYWDKLMLDSIAAKSIVIADKLFDISVNIGYAKAGLWLQQVLNVLNRGGTDYPDVTEDGNIGAKTIAAFNSYMAKNNNSKSAQKNIIYALFSMQVTHYITISQTYGKNETFTNGWLNRAGYHLDFYISMLT